MTEEENAVAEEEEAEEEEMEEEISVDDDLQEARSAAVECGKLLNADALLATTPLGAQCKRLVEAFSSLDEELSEGGELPIDWEDQ